MYLLKNKNKCSFKQKSTKATCGRGEHRSHLSPIKRCQTKTKKMGKWKNEKCVFFPLWMIWWKQITDIPRGSSFFVKSDEKYFESLFSYISPLEIDHYDGKLSEYFMHWELSCYFYFTYSTLKQPDLIHVLWTNMLKLDRATIWFSWASFISKKW